MTMRVSFVAALLAAAACGCPKPAQTVPPPPPPAAPAPVATPVAQPVPAAPADPMAREVALTPEITMGHLSNGLTYYVMHHQKPEQRASLWLAVNAGSVLEDDDQRGLAHFCEHMAFNGTKHFPKMDIVNYIEKVGMQFGADVNAYTSFDETVYMLTVPTDDHSAMMKGLDILRDWAGEVSFDPVEVDKERGVVLEEWRLGRGAFARINDKQWPVMFQGSRYAKRLPIGDPDILRTAKRDTLVRFYKDWYRPDNMAVIAVGDFDAAEIEKQIQAKFGDLTNPANERARAAIPVPHDHEPAVSIETDPEMPFTSVGIANKMDHRSNSTKGDYRRFIVENLYHTMLRNRFNELKLDPAAPFTFAGSSTSAFPRTNDSFERWAEAKAGHTAETLALLTREVARVEKFGFLKSELDRAEREALARMENDEKEWEKTPDPQISSEIVRNFLAKEQMPGRTTELAMSRELMPTVTLDELNHLAKQWGGEKGRVITLAGPANQKMPTEAEVRAVVSETANAKLEPWKDDTADRQLLAKAPAPGKVVATAHDDKTDATVWTLSNGIKVIVKPTTFQNDEISFTGWQPGGTSVLSDADFDQVRFRGLITAMGVGDLDPVTLQKVLAGKVAEATVGYDELAETANGSARPADLETMMQLLYLRFTAPRKDLRAFDAWKQSTAEWLNHKRLLPEVEFQEQMQTLWTGNHHRRQPDTTAMLDQVNVDKVLAIYKDRFKDVGHFTFVFVGNVDLAKLQPLVETYLGSLPGGKRNEKWKDVGVHYPTHTVKKDVVAGTEPKSSVRITMGAPDKWTLEGAQDARILSMVLRIRLREVLREDMGGVYGVGVWASLWREPAQRRYMSISFGCDPANVDKLKQAAFDVVAEFAKNGAGAEYLDKVREQLKREHETDLKENRWWLDTLRDTYYFGDDFTKTTDLAGIEARVTSDNVKAAAKRFFAPNNYVLGVMRPKVSASAEPAKPAKP